MTSISVVIPAYEHILEVLTCLRSLQATASQTIPIEFIVSDDSSKLALAQYIPQCAAKVVTRDVNGGFGQNANTGASVASGDIILFCNQDVFAVEKDINGNPLSQHWDIPLVCAFNDATIGIVGAKLLFPDGRIQNAGGKYDVKGQPWHRGLGYANIEYAEVNTPEYVSWTTGAALAIRRELFVQLGGFDPVYEKAYWEDVDLCERVKQVGYKVWYEPRCAFVHHVGTSGGSPMFAKNAQTFKQRWVDTKIVKSDTEAIKERFW